MLPGGPRCVHELRLSLALSSVLHCPMFGFRVAFTTLTTGLGLSLVPYPSSSRLGFVPQLVAQLCALQPLSPSLRVVLTDAVGLGGGGYWFSPLCSLVVGPLPGPPALHCLLSAGCLLGLATSPSGEASAST